MQPSEKLVKSENMQQSHNSKFFNGCSLQWVLYWGCDCMECDELWPYTTCGKWVWLTVLLHTDKMHLAGFCRGDCWFHSACSYSCDPKIRDHGPQSIQLLQTYNY